MQSLGRNEELHRALEQTYTAHITNTLQDVLVIDLLRELGALVLDDDRGSASVARAMSALRDQDVISELQREYEVVRPLANVGGDKLTPQQRAQLDAQWQQSERREQLERFERFRQQLGALDKELTESKVGEKLWKARCKGVAHYDVVRSGEDWKLWRVEGTGLTWGQINTYVDKCSEAIEVLLALVRQTSFDFNGSKEVAQGYVDEFIDAVVRGLRSQKQEHREKRERLIRERE
jgi:AbiU2